MPLIVVTEDDAGTRMLVGSVLRKDGYQVLLAENGAQGLAMAEQSKPDLVISDIQMPEMNGFEMLAALRARPNLASTPVILLTSLQERAHMRQGMNTGADDYITKPFHPAELREAVAAQLGKREMNRAMQNLAVDAAVQSALADQKHKLAKLYEQRLFKELQDRWPTGDGDEADVRLTGATVLFVDMPHYGVMAEKLSEDELSDLVKRFYASVGDTVHLFGARHMQFVGDGLLAIFAEEADTRSVNHGLRAVRAALGLIDSAHRLRHHQEKQFADRGLPRFEVNVALHSGPVTLTRVHEPLHNTLAQVLPVGDAVVAAMQLQKQAYGMGWTIAASMTVLRSVTGAVRIGSRALVDLPGRSAALDAAELLGLAQ
ncbi:MAG: response regulator [Burkholderiales bacterium]|jgi:CheY-like chemotaxis protein|nr:response regulator [Burkholderiales bacterium]